MRGPAGSVRSTGLRTTGPLAIHQSHEMFGEDVQSFIGRPSSFTDSSIFLSLTFSFKDICNATALHFERYESESAAQHFSDGEEGMQDPRLSVMILIRKQSFISYKL